MSTRELLGILLILGVSLMGGRQGTSQTLSTCVPKAEEELRALAVDDPVPQIRAAAAEALSQFWLHSQASLEELEALATEGASPELRRAAIQPLTERYRAANLSLSQLKNIVMKHPSPEVRRAVGPILSIAWVQSLSAIDADIANFQVMARDGVNPEIRQVAADIIFMLLRESIRAEHLERIAAGEAVTLEAYSSGAGTVKTPFRFTVTLDGQTQALRAAAAKLLIGWFIGFPRFVLKEPIADLTQLALEGQTAELRWAAGKALGHYLNQSDLSLEELERIATEGATVEYRLAGGEAMKLRLLEGVKARTVSIEDLLTRIETGASQEVKDAAISPLARLYLC